MRYFNGQLWVCKAFPVADFAFIMLSMYNFIPGIEYCLPAYLYVLAIGKSSKQICLCSQIVIPKAGKGQLWFPSHQTKLLLSGVSDCKDKDNSTHWILCLPACYTYWCFSMVSDQHPRGSNQLVVIVERGQPVPSQQHVNFIEYSLPLATSAETTSFQLKHRPSLQHLDEPQYGKNTVESMAFLYLLYYCNTR